MAKDTNSNDDQQDNSNSGLYLADVLRDMGVDPDGAHSYGQKPVLDQEQERRAT
jgi:hypothetical protein